MKSTQFGTFSVFVFTGAFILLIFLGIKLSTETSDLMPVLIPGIVSLVMLFCLLIFYQLTITVDNEFVSFKFGLGWFGKKYKISDIKSCRPVRNSVLYGIGVRFLPNGILYNVSGLSAIELSFKGKNRIVRIGSHEAEKVSAYINSKLENTAPVSFVQESPSRWRLLLFWSIVSLVIVVPVFIVVYGRQEAKVSVNENSLVIKGMYSEEIPLNTISMVDTVSTLPEIEMRTNGFAAGGVCKGNFRLKEVGEAKLYVNLKCSPYIVFKTSDNKLFYLNFNEKIKTIELFRLLVIKRIK
ncbi:MAG: PH domain-containing protein [Bacteroidales bacterium]